MIPTNIQGKDLELTLKAFVNIFNIEIEIASKLGNDSQVSINPENSNLVVSINPENSNLLGGITVGHFAEYQGD